MLCQDWSTNNDLIEKNEKLTRMLCEVLTFTKDYVSVKFSNETEKWWEERKTLDEIRKKAELRQKQLRQKALSKLTSEERKVLGI